MENKINALKCEKFKEFIHPMFMPILASKTTGKLHLIGSFPENDNYLIVANHVCIEDIPTLGEAVKKHFYLLVSDEDKGTLDGLALELNGVEWVHRLDKESRKNAYESIVKILKKGKNFGMYPEATWNLSSNKFIMDMNYGCIKMALEAGKKIVPVVTYFSEKDRYTKIGKPLTPTSDLLQSISDLKDEMSTMYFELMNLYYEDEIKNGSNNVNVSEDGSYYENRADLPEDYWDRYVESKYDAYGRAKNDMDGVRSFESNFIFTPKGDAYEFFQEFNSTIRKDNNGNLIVKRISSEKNGFNGNTFGEVREKGSFGFGYNEDVLKRSLKK